MAQTSMLGLTTPQPDLRERRTWPRSRKTSRAPLDWRGPHLARLDAWLERRQRILGEAAQCASRARVADRRL